MSSIKQKVQQFWDEFNNGNLTLIPIDSVSKIDIYSEGVPLFLADDGLGGAINLKLEDWERGRLGFGARGGSYDYIRAFGKNETQKPFSSQVFLEYTQSTEDFSYFDDNGTPFNPDDDRYSKRSGNEFKRGVLFPRILIRKSLDETLSAFSLNAYSDSQIPGATSLPTKGKLYQFYNLSALSYDVGTERGFSSSSRLFFRADSEKLNMEQSSFGGPYSSRSKALALGFRKIGRASCRERVYVLV